MPSYAKQIGDAMVAIITGLPGAPTLVKLRMDNAILGRETPPAVIVTVEDEAKVGRAYEGVIYKEYKVVIGIYRVCLADVRSNLDLNPAFILECKQAFDTTSLSGAPAVWDIDLVDNPEWEHKPFGQGWEVSRFGLLVKTRNRRIERCAIAAISFTTANISPGTTIDAHGACTIQRGIAGTAITPGMDVVIKTSDGLVYPAQATATTMASHAGVALNAATASQPVNYASAGPVNFGTTVLSVGQVYVLGSTAGQIHPAADLTSGWFSSRLGWAYSASVLVVDIKNTGVTA